MKSMNKNQIMEMSRKELVAACKEAGIKASGKTVDLQEALIATIPAKREMPKEYWAIYRAISKKNPNLSNKAVATRARYAYQKRYAQATVEAE